jgi:ubiquinone/menaquinone biosynthesis C-methylase UbiE
VIAEGSVDSPRVGATVFQHNFDVVGWAASRDGRPWKRVTVLAGDTVLGETLICFHRPDVATALGTKFLNVGFSVRCRLPGPLRRAGPVELECRVEYHNGERGSLPRQAVVVSAIDYQARDYGGVLHEAFDAVLPRAAVYTTGDPAQRADDFCAQLVRRYLHPGEHVLDIGCGIGAWAGALAPFDIDWTGCEMRVDFVKRMVASGLPAVHVTDTLPFADRSFDATICIEVLEHVVDPAPFLAEVARVSRRAAIFSVPNFAAIPVTSARYAVPWHMLEGDHKWFFTAHSLAGLLKSYYAHVETFEYGELEYLHSIDGIPINNHIMAIALH